MAYVKLCISRQLLEEGREGGTKPKGYYFNSENLQLLLPFGALQQILGRQGTKRSMVVVSIFIHSVQSWAFTKILGGECDRASKGVIWVVQWVLLPLVASLVGPGGVGFSCPRWKNKDH